MLLFKNINKNLSYRRDSAWCRWLWF